jgi:cholesterol oxidase
MERRAIDQLAHHMLAHVTDVEHPAQALVLLGDQIYADAAANVMDMQESDERLAQMYRDAWGGWPATRALLASVPVYFAVDDHEYTDNWHGAANPVADDSFLNGFEAALAYQWRWTHSRHHTPKVHARSAPRSAGAVAHPPTPLPTAGAGVRGFWTPFTIDHLPAFAMDTRSERAFRAPVEPDAPLESGTKNTAWSQVPIVSEAQMQAVENWLLAHRLQPKVLCMGSVLGWVERELLTAPRRCALSDDWAAYPASWRRLVRFMVQHRIEHTIFLTGDYHFSGVAELSLESDLGPSVRAVSVVCSGWNASLPFANASPHDFVLNQPAAMPFSDEHARLRCTAHSLGTAPRQFSKLTLSPALHGGSTLSVRVFDESGDAIGQWHGFI